MSTTLATEKDVTNKTMPPPMPLPVPAAVREIPLGQIEPSPWNRKRFNEQALDDLAGSIVNTGGVVQPIVLRPYPALVLRKSLVSEQHFIDVKGTKTGSEAYKNREAAEAALVGMQRYQVVAGERRWLASKRAVAKLGFKRDTITATVKEMTDAQALEVTLTENAQREDVPVLELCRTYKALLGQKDSTSGQPYTREMIADRVKKSYSLVCAILNADQAIAEVQKAAAEGKLGDSLVLEIAKYTPAQQMDIFLACFDEHSRLSLKAIEKDKNAETSVSVRQLRTWIAEHIHIELKNAPFDTKDEFLLKGVPSCVKCPKRTGSNPGLFADSAEVQKGDTCTDPGCYDAKKQAFVQIRIAEEQRKDTPAPPPAVATVHVPAKTALGVKPLGAAFSQTSALAAAGKAAKQEKTVPVLEIQQISSQYLSWGEKGKPGILYQGQFELAKPGCKKEKKSIWRDGPKIGQTTFICDVKNCTNHGYSYSSGGGGTSRAPVTFKRKVEIWDSRVQLIYRDSLAKEIVAAKPLPALGDPEIHIVTDYVLTLMHHQDKGKIRRLLGLKDGKSWDSSALDKYAKGLKGAELLRFMLLCCLSGELGLEDQYFGGNLTKTDPLAVVAALYKVDDAKLLAGAKAQLEKKRPKSDAEKKAAESTKAKEWAGVEKIADKRIGKPLDAPKKVKTSKPAAKKAKPGKTKKKK